MFHNFEFVFFSFVAAIQLYEGEALARHWDVQGLRLGCVRKEMEV